MLLKSGNQAPKPRFCMWIPRVFNFVNEYFTNGTWLWAQETFHDKSPACHQPRLLALPVSRLKSLLQPIVIPVPLPWASEVLAAGSASFDLLTSLGLQKISEPQALCFSDEWDGTCRAFDFCHWLRGCTLSGCSLKTPPTTHRSRILPPDLMYMGVSAPPANSRIPAECRAIQLTSETVYLKTASDSTGSVPQDGPLLQILVTSPGCCLCFWWTGCQLKAPMILSLGLINFLNWLPWLRKPF